MIQHPGALHQLFSSPTELSLGEAYIYNDYDIEGDIESAVRFGIWLMMKKHTLYSTTATALSVVAVARPPNVYAKD